MTRTLLASLVVLLSLAGCGAPEALPETQSRTDGIVNGVGRNEATFGGVLVEGPAPCSGGLLAPDLVLTHARCVAATQVRSAGVTVAVELARAVPGSNGELITLQLRKKLPSSTFVWRLTSTRVKVDEVLSCFGFDGARVFGSGTFRVVDVSGEAISLRGGAVGFNAFDVGTSDDGGFCIRDGSFELAAALAKAGPGARALQVSGLKSSFSDLMNAIVQARVPALGLVSMSRVARDPRQGFYLAPTGAPDEVQLVNANSGRCLAMGPRVGHASCDASQSNQRWKMSYLQPFFTTGGMTDGYRFAVGGLCLAHTGGLLPAMPCGWAPVNTDVYGMWLNQF